MADPSSVRRLADLTDTERLLIDTLRRRLAGGSFCWDLKRRLARDLGGGTALVLLDRLEAAIRVLARYAHRRIAFHHPCCPILAMDEAEFLDLAAAARSGAAACFDATAQDFVIKEGLAPLGAAMRLLTAALDRAEISLPAPYGRQRGWAITRAATLH